MAPSRIGGLENVPARFWSAICCSLVPQVRFLSLSSVLPLFRCLHSIPGGHGPLKVSRTSLLTFRTGYPLPPTEVTWYLRSDFLPLYTFKDSFFVRPLARTRPRLLTSIPQEGCLFHVSLMLFSITFYSQMQKPWWLPSPAGTVPGRPLGWGSYHSSPCPSGGRWAGRRETGGPHVCPPAPYPRGFGRFNTPWLVHPQFDRLSCQQRLFGPRWRWLRTEPQP